MIALVGYASLALIHSRGQVGQAGTAVVLCWPRKESNRLKLGLEPTIESNSWLLLAIDYQDCEEDTHILP